MDSMAGTANQRDVTMDNESVIERIVNLVASPIERIKNPPVRRVAGYGSLWATAGVLVAIFLWGTIVLAALARDYLGIGVL